jgi:kynureninase
MMCAAQGRGGGVEGSLLHARAMDAQDPLRAMRDLFCVPRRRDVAPAAGGTTSGDEPCVYMCGNSLGLMPKATRDAVVQELDDWARFGVEGHFHAQHPWYPYHEELRETAARMVGGLPHEVVVMNSLSVNLHLMMTSFYRPTRERFRIVIEDSAFPSDSYAVQSQAALHGFDPREAIVRLTPRAGERVLRTEDIEDYLREQGSGVAMMMLGGVNYLTGQVMDMQRLTEAGHRAGARVGWDLAHAAGNVVLKLHEWDADFACWCSYKYLNSGPGAVAGCFVHERHVRNTAGFGASGALTRLAGWWGNDPKTRFAMTPDFVPVASADAWSLSNPPVLATAPVRVSLEIFDRATMPALRRKSEGLTGYLQWLLDGIPGAERVLEVITPRDPAARGCQLSLAIKDRAREFHRALAAQGVVCDFREPNVIRLAPTPLYNTFEDCWRFSEILRGHAAGR